MNRHRYDIEFLKEKYHQRWSIETLFEYMKFNINLDFVKGTSEKMVLQEICGKFITHLIAQVNVLQAIDKAGGNLKACYPYKRTNILVKNGHKYNYSINFSETLAEVIPKLYLILHPSRNYNVNAIIELLIEQRFLVPIRPGRKFERCSKRANSKWSNTKYRNAVRT